jgi:hypothetical protein
LDSKESIERELYLKKVDEEFKNIVIYLKISSSYITKKNYFKIVNFLLDKLSNIGVDRRVFQGIKRNIKKVEKGF